MSTGETSLDTRGPTPGAEPRLEAPSAPRPWARRDVLAVGSLVAAWSLVVAVVGLGGDFPLNDDWAYHASAARIAATGEVRILDWAAPSLVSHLAWGALLIRLFGDSYVVLRCGTLLFGLAGLVFLYVLGRRARMAPAAAAVLALAVGLSPWYVNLSFTYMTDVPWLVAMLGATVALAFADVGRPARKGALLLLSGALIAAAALSRQFAIVTLPAFVLVAALDARDRPRPGRLFRAAAVALPVLLAYAAFHLWYSHVHGPTVAYRETWSRMGERSLVHPLANALAAFHYIGFWLFPFVLASAVAPNGDGLQALVRRRVTAVAGLLLSGYAIAAALPIFLQPDRTPGMNAAFPPTMPYLGNLAYLVGVGPPTISDVYRGLAPLPHPGRGLGFPLTVASTLGGALGAAWVVDAGRRSLRNLRAAEPGDAAARIRTLLLSWAALYLLFHLATGKFLYDRYVFVVMPAAVFVALEAASSVATSRWALLPLAVVALYSAGGTREYLAWNAARAQAVRDLEARGVPGGEIDGGFEVNGPRRFDGHVARTGRLMPSPGVWWTDGERYRISFWPSSRDGRCRPLPERYAYWTFPGTGPRAIHVLDCRPEEPPLLNP